MARGFGAEPMSAAPKRVEDVADADVDDFVALLEADVAAKREQLGATLRVLGKLQIRQLLDREYRLEMARRARMTPVEKARAARELTDELTRFADVAESRRSAPPTRPARKAGACT
jgi:hypothetical protein